MAFHGFYDPHMDHPPLVFDGQTGQLRLRLLEVAAQITASVRVRRILVRLPRACPLAGAFGSIARQLCAT